MDMGFDDEWTFYVETPPFSLSSSFASTDPAPAKELPSLGIPRYRAPQNPVPPVQPAPPEGDTTGPKEIESRAVEILNVPKEYGEHNIQEIIDPPSIVEYFEMQETTLFIEFYDIRHAMVFKNFMATHHVDVRYGTPRRLRTKSDVPVNLGTIVLLHLAPTMTNQQLQCVFSQFGEIRQIRGTPYKPTQRFIEYWDIRSSQKAVDTMSGTILSGSKIVIEFSMPGVIVQLARHQDFSEVYKPDLSRMLEGAPLATQEVPSTQRRRKRSSFMDDSLVTVYHSVKEEAELAALFADRTRPITDVLLAPMVLSSFKDNNELLMSRLEADFVTIMHILENSGNRRLVFVVGELFLSTNTFLLENVTKDVVVMQAFADIIAKGRQTELDFFKVGICTRVLVKAAGIWPTQVFEKMFEVPTFFHAAISNGSSAVKWLLESLITLSDENTSAFLWAFLLALFEGKMTAQPPISWNLGAESIVICSDLILEKPQRLIIYGLFGDFLAKMRGTSCGDHFRDVLSLTIPELIMEADIEEKGAILKLASLLPSLSCFVDLAFDILDGELNTVSAEMSILYLATSASMIPTNKAICLFFRLLKPDTEKNNFVLKAAAQLMSQMIKKSAHPRFFAKAIEHVIAYSWNRRAEYNMMSYSSCLLGYANFFKDSATWIGWDMFVYEVVNRFNAQVSFNREFVFSEDDWDKTLITLLVSGKVSYEYPPEDSIPYLRRDAVDSPPHIPRQPSNPKLFGGIPSGAPVVKKVPKKVRIGGSQTVVTVKPRAGTPGPKTTSLLNPMDIEKMDRRKKPQADDDKKCQVQ